jgi:hypothetical protein
MVLSRALNRARESMQEGARIAAARDGASAGGQERIKLALLNGELEAAGAQAPIAPMPVDGFRKTRAARLARGEAV